MGKKKKNGTWEKEYTVPLFPCELLIAFADSTDEYLVSKGLRPAGRERHAIEMSNGSLSAICFRREPDVPWEGLIAHEAFHAVQTMMRYIGEDEPGEETFAYLLEWVVTTCHEAKKTAKIP